MTHQRDWAAGYAAVCHARREVGGYDGKAKERAITRALAAGLVQQLGVTHAGTWEAELARIVYRLLTATSDERVDLLCEAADLTARAHGAEECDLRWERERAGRVPSDAEEHGTYRAVDGSVAG